MPGTIHVTTNPYKSPAWKVLFSHCIDRQIEIKDVKAIGQGHGVAEAGHLWDAKAQVLSVTPHASQWVKENNTGSLVCFSHTEHLCKVCPFSVLHFSCP